MHSTVEVSVGGLDRTLLFDTTAHGDFWKATTRGAWLPETLHLLVNPLHDGSCCVGIGARTGVTALRVRPHIRHSASLVARPHGLPDDQRMEPLPVDPIPNRTWQPLPRRNIVRFLGSVRDTELLLAETEHASEPHSRSLPIRGTG